MNKKSEKFQIKSDLPVILNDDTVSYRMIINTETSRIIWKPVILNKNLKFEKFNQFMDQLKKDVTDTFKRFDINDQGKLEFVLTDSTESVRFHHTLLQMFGLKSQNYKNEPKGKLFIGDHVVRQNNEISKQIFIYSSLTEPIRVGNVTVPLLRTILAKDGWDEIVNYVVEKPIYLPISNNNINNIEVNIRDDLGRPINFPYGSKSVLTIHFKNYDRP